MLVEKVMKSELETYYNINAEDYESKMFWCNSVRNRKRLFDILEPKNKNVVDIGCGNGANVLYLKAAENITLFDFSYNMLLSARARCLGYGITNVNYKNGDIEKTSIKSGLKNLKFDLAISTYLLTACIDPSQAVKNIARSVKKDGLYAVLDFTWGCGRTCEGFGNTVEINNLLKSNEYFERVYFDFIPNQKQNQFIYIGKKV